MFTNVQELQNKRVNMETQPRLFVCLHVCSRSFNNTSIVIQFTHRSEIWRQE